jgi:hypothetical protein
LSCFTWHCEPQQLVAPASQQLVPQTRVVQLALQLPLWHVSPEGQAFPQLPQLLASVWRFTQVVGLTFGQAVGSEAGQPHEPVVHTPFTRQVVPQAPQLAGSVWKFTQAVVHSFGYEPEQPQTPVWQTPLVLHWVPQAPQLLTLVFRSTQAGDPPQSVVPALHTHAPAVQVPAPQAWKQVPQLF